jgi:chromosome segregation ATPase
MGSLPGEVMTIGEHQCMRLEEYDHQVEAKDRLIDDLRKGNREILQQAHSLERRNKEMNDELLRMYRSFEFKTQVLNSTHTQLQHANDLLDSDRNYAQHLETELAERDQQLEASQAHVEELKDVVHHLHELLPQDEELEEDPEEVQGMSGVEDN